MATSFHNKLNDLEARFKASEGEAASQKRDRIPRDINLSLVSPIPRRLKPCKKNSMLVNNRHSLYQYNHNKTFLMSK